MSDIRKEKLINEIVVILSGCDMQTLKNNLYSRTLKITTSINFTDAVLASTTLVHELSIIATNLNVKKKKGKHTNSTCSKYL